MTARRPTARALARRIDAGLRAAADPERATQEKAYLKSSLHFYGNSLGEIRRVVRDVLATVPDLDHDTLVGLVTTLWDTPARRPVHERRHAANEALEARMDLVESRDLPLLERMLRTSLTWALVDDLAAVVVGHVFEADPALGDEVLERWIHDDDFWIRRSALLTHLIPLRKGRGDWDRFARYADLVLDEKEFFIRKAIGWVLRDTSRKRPDLVAAWVAPRTDRISGVTIREAVRRLDDATRDALMAGYRAHQPTELPTRSDI
jgi:3-methyladenine DNA glycosylase AlkD